MPVKHTLNVDLGERSYPIYIGSGIVAESELLTRHIHGQSALVVTNETVAPLYLEAVTASLDSAGIRHDKVVLEDGEKYKTLNSVSRIIDLLLY